MGRKSKASKEARSHSHSKPGTDPTTTSTSTSPTLTSTPTPAPATASPKKQDAREVKRLISDLAFETSLNKHLTVLASHSQAVWNYSFKNYQQYGRGCVYWLFTSLSQAEKLHSWIDMTTSDAKDTETSLPIEYRSQTRAAQMEYPPVDKFIQAYNPYRETVCLVAIHTGDARDSLMKVVVIDRSVRDMVTDPSHNLQNEHWLSFASPASGEHDKIITLIDGYRFCSNLMCYAMETSMGQFKACSSCKFQYYCSKECQVMHWKLGGHKATCTSEAAYVTPPQTQPFQSFFQAKAAREQLYQHAKSLANPSPASLPVPAPQNGAASSSPVLAPSQAPSSSTSSSTSTSPSTCDSQSESPSS